MKQTQKESPLSNTSTSKQFQSLFRTLSIQLFDVETKKRKGNGFFHNGIEFVHHTVLPHHETAFQTLIAGHKLFFASAGLSFALALIINWHATLLVTVSTLTIFYFADLLFNLFLIVRTFQKSPELKFSKQKIAKLSDEELPTYSIFCPLYKEWKVVPQFMAAMDKLDYPKEKLQIMFLLEEDDKETISKIRENTLPFYYQVLVIPHSKPKTKPKAMNFGLYYAEGEFLVVYDAEDVPEPSQLKKAVLAFRESPRNTVCIQAKLNFYNPHQNLLTRIFTAEYSLWFDLILPGLQSINAPIPLGGTSNHFRTEDIKTLNGWDAFNVTEDCDLGIRLAKKGFRTAIIDSTTHEEANSQNLNWYRQRSRWIKGYIQTYLVHMRKPLQFTNGNHGSIKNLFIFQLVVGGKIMSMFINPLMWMITIIYFLFRGSVGPFIESFFPTTILYIGVFSFLVGNFLYMYYYMLGCAKRGHYSIIKYAFLVPFYWLAMSAAAWQAVYEIIIKPHYWAKTAHGLHLQATDPVN